jgi:hypothetical protein
MLTSRVETSRYAVLLLFDGSNKPRLVGKVARRPHHQERLGTEFEMLQIAARASDGRRAPIPLAFAEHRGHWLLIETALAGGPLNRHRLRRRPLRCWRLVEQWLCSVAEAAAYLPPVTGSPVLPVPLQRVAPQVPKVDERWCEQQIAGPLRLMAEELPATNGERHLFDATATRALELATGEVPAPVEHGDLFPANLLVSGRERIAAIDWELGRAAGLAGADAAVFLFGLLHGLDGPQRISRSASYAKNFLAADGLGRRLLTAHLERCGVDPRWVDHVLLATWARRCLQVWLPVVMDDAPGGVPDAGRNLFRSFWALHFWRMTLDRLAS